MGTTRIMADSDRQFIPEILPVEGGDRPLWSVLIPAYNGAEYLARTIRSVLQQDPGPEVMQIEVVDDHSPLQDLRKVVESEGRGRVGYYRQPQNVGITRNFNTCIARSRGEWVHILHGDDTVMPGFYEKLGAAISVANVGCAFCRSLFIDENDQWLNLSEREQGQAGILAGWAETIGTSNRVWTPSMIVRRQAYEKLGGYDTRLSHCADWDMWQRITASYPVWYEPEVLACYRIHANSDTSRLVRSGGNIAEIRFSIDLARRYYSPAMASRVSAAARKYYARAALSAAQASACRADYAAAKAQIWESVKTDNSPRILLSTLRLILRSALRPGQRK